MVWWLTTVHLLSIFPSVLAPKEEWIEPDAAAIAKCGAKFKVVQDDGDGEEKEGVPKEQVYMLAGIYLVFAIIGPTIIFFFLDPLSKYGEDERKEQKVRIWSRDVTLINVSKFYCWGEVIDF